VKNLRSAVKNLFLQAIRVSSTFIVISMSNFSSINSVTFSSSTSRASSIAEATSRHAIVASLQPFASSSEAYSGLYLNGAVDTNAWQGEFEDTFAQTASPPNSVLQGGFDLQETHGDLQGGYGSQETREVLQGEFDPHDLQSCFDPNDVQNSCYQHDLQSGSKFKNLQGEIDPKYLQS